MGHTSTRAPHFYQTQLPWETILDRRIGLLMVFLFGGFGQFFGVQLPVS